MAFPFSMFNIAHLAAGFKSQTHSHTALDGRLKFVSEKGA